MMYRQGQNHGAFIAKGIPGLMITDTANYRGHCYHQTCDTPDRLDYTRLASLAGLLGRALPALVNNR